MTDIEKQVILQRINEEINQFKVRINNIFEEGISKDDFLSSLGNVVLNKSQIIPLNQKGTAPLGGAVPEISIDDVDNYLKTNFKFVNDYLINQAKGLLNHTTISDIDQDRINTAYAIVLTKSGLFNNLSKGKKDFILKNNDFNITYQNNELIVGFSFNINFDWYERSITNYCCRMSYEIPSISLIEYNPNPNK